MVDTYTLFYTLVIVVVFLALVFQLVPFILYVWMRRSEEERIVNFLKESGARDITPEELTNAFKILRESTNPTPVTRSTLALLPIVIVGIAILYLITSNIDIITTYAGTNTTINATGAVSNSITTSNSLINTLLGVFAGFLTAAAGFYFGTKAVAKSSTDSHADEGTEELKRALRSRDEK